MPKGKVTTLMEKNVTFDHAVNYLINSFARKGIRLISIPVLTYLLTPADYGIINVFSANVELAAILLTLNANVGVGRYYFEKGKDDFGSLLFVSMLISFSPIAILLGNYELECSLDWGVARITDFGYLFYCTSRYVNRVKQFSPFCVSSCR